VKSKKYGELRMKGAKEIFFGSSIYNFGENSINDDDIEITFALVLDNWILCLHYIL